MKLEPVAIWTNNLEQSKDYYQTYFNVCPNAVYTNKAIGFNTHFLTFQSGVRLESTSKPDIPENRNDTVGTQHLGIIHLAFDVETVEEVE